jgi:hypothetical protein
MRPRTPRPDPLQRSLRPAEVSSFPRAGGGHLSPRGGTSISTLAVIVLAAVAVLLLAMLIAGARKAARIRHHDLDTGDDGQPYRSHAEASRGR